MIEIKKLPEVDIMGKKYQIKFEINKENVEDVRQRITQMPEDGLEKIKNQTKELTDLLLYAGAFDEIFKPFNGEVGIGSYIAFLNDLILEISDKYNEINDSMNDVNKIIEKAKKRKAQKHE